MGYGNSFGKLLKITTFGESHGNAVGVIIEGFPAGFKIDTENLHYELARRKPGQSPVTTTRQEDEELEILSGYFQEKTTGTPLCIVVKNKDARSKDYDFIKDIYRPSHADFTYHKKYDFYDYRGGGRASARETVARVLAGAIAKQFLFQREKIKIHAYTEQIYNIKIPENQMFSYEDTEKNIVRCPHKKTAEKMIALIREIKKQGDSVGGIIKCVVENMPVGLGEPVFDKLEARLASAMMSLPASKAFEIGKGFSSVLMKGSEHNDLWEIRNGNIRTKTNNAGGTLGGISNGENLVFRVAFKPTSTVMKPQKSVSKQGKETELPPKGRHDPCVVPRAVPIVEAMTAIVLLDFYLLQKTRK